MGGNPQKGGLPVHIHTTYFTLRAAGWRIRRPVAFKSIEQTSASIQGSIRPLCPCKSFGSIIPSLTLVKVKSGYKSSNYADCSHFLFENDLCYFFTSFVLVLFIMLRMADFEINS